MKIGDKVVPTKTCRPLYGDPNEMTIVDIKENKVKTSTYSFWFEKHEVLAINDTTNQEQKEITQLVGSFFCHQTYEFHLFFRIGTNCFSWCTFKAQLGRFDPSRCPGVKHFSQEPELELYQAQTWQQAKKWFENP